MSVGSMRMRRTERLLEKAGKRRSRDVYFSVRQVSRQDHVF